MSDRTFYGFTLSFILGVALESVFGLGYLFAVMLAAIASIFLLYQVSMRVRWSFLVSLVLFGGALGVARLDVSLQMQNAHALGQFIGETVYMQGIVLYEPDVREEYVNIVLEVRDVLYKGVPHVFKETSRVLVRVPTHPSFRYGDEIMVEGKVVVPKNFAAEEGQRMFDYRAYLAKDGIHYQVFFPKVSLIAHDRGNVLYRKMFALKELLLKNLAHMIPEPQASLAGGILLGAKQSLGEELMQKFRETGVAHIVVLSGYNIAIVAGVVSRVAILLPFVVRVGASVVAIVLFAMMVGGEATVVRATIMALIVIVARATGREGDALRALVLAGWIMVLHRPMILFHDVSFQLSFTATLALIVLVPVVKKYFLFITNDMVREICVTTFAVQLFVMPLIVYHMGNVSLIGFVVNLFVLPVVPIAMLASSFVALFAHVPLVGGASALVSYALLAYMISIVSVFSHIPFASLSGISFPLWALVLSYALFWILIKRSPRALHK